MNFADRISHPRLQSLFLLWANARKGKLMPLEQDFSFSSLSDTCKPHAFQFMVEGPGDNPAGDSSLSFRCSHLGHEAQIVLGNVEGQLAEVALRGQVRHVLLRILDATAGNLLVHYYHKTLAVTGGGHPVVESKLLLPLTTDGETCSAVLGALYHNPRGEIPGETQTPYDSQFVEVHDIEQHARSVRTITR